MSKTIAILVHGYNVSDPGETVGKLRPYFENENVLVEVFNYGYWPFTWQVRKRNPAEARYLAERCRYWKDKGYRVIVVGHSNGVAITYLASKNYQAKIDVCVGINPALEVSLNPSPNAETVQIWHNKGDRPVKWAVLIRKVFKGVNARPWGAMGNIGYRGSDSNVVNFNAGEDFYQKADGHSDVFSKKKAPYFLQLIAALAVNK